MTDPSKSPPRLSAATNRRVDRGAFLQSRVLHADSTTMDPLWFESLFRYLNDRPRSAAYSMAFALAYYPTYGITTAGLRADERIAVPFDAAREIFDLMHESIASTDTLSREDIERTRLFDKWTFAAANDAYHDSYDKLVVPILRMYGALSPASSADERTREQIVDAFVKLYHGPEKVRNFNDLRAVSIRTDIVRIRDVLRRVNDCANETHMLLHANPTCFRTVRVVDLTVFTELLAQLETMRHDEILNETTVRSIAIALTSFVINDPSIGGARSAEKMGSPYGGRPYTLLEAFACYAPMMYRFESLSLLVDRWNESRALEISRSDRDKKNCVDGDDGCDPDDEAIRCFMIPQRSVWQAGNSQLLWLTVHILAALTVERRNYYIQRFLVICSNLSFFIGCAECSWHWSQNRGDAYFRDCATLPSVVLNSLPIDIVLLRCHNVVRANSTRNASSLSSWTVAQLCVDFRDFAKRCLLSKSGKDESDESDDATRSKLEAWRNRANLCSPVAAVVLAVANDRQGDDPAFDDIRIDGASLATTNVATLRNFLTTMLMPIEMTATTRPVPTNAATIGSFHHRTHRHRLRLFEGDSVTADPTSIREEKIRDNVALSAIRHYYGDRLLRHLWHYVDPKMNVPICAMW